MNGGKHFIVRQSRNCGNVLPILPVFLLWSGVECSLVVYLITQLIVGICSVGLNGFFFRLIHCMQSHGGPFVPAFVVRLLKNSV